MRLAGERPLGLQLIIGYKLAKAALVIALAAWLTASSGAAYREARHLIALLNEHPGVLHRLAQWLDARVTLGAVHTARIVAWLDGAATLVEGLLLLTGRAWGEWLVVAGVAALLPFEVIGVVAHPRLPRVAVLVINAAIVAYLVWLRLRARHRHRAPLRA